MRPLDVQSGQIDSLPAFFGCRHDLVTHGAVAAETHMNPCAVPTLGKFENQLVELDFPFVPHFDDFFCKRQRSQTDSIAIGGQAETVGRRWRTADRLVHTLAAKAGSYDNSAPNISADFFKLLRRLLNVCHFSRGGRILKT